MLLGGDIYFMVIESNVGDKIRSKRRQIGYSITDLSELSGISRQYISQIERGESKNPSTEVLKKLCECLDIPMEYLFQSSSDIFLYELLEEDKPYTNFEKQELLDYVQTIKKISGYSSGNKDISLSIGSLKLDIPDHLLNKFLYLLLQDKELD